MFKSILIANRGEIALRVIRACQALGIRAVAAYSEADRHSPHLPEADETVCIGGPRSEDSYLDMEALLQAAIQTECQAIHPGYGFLAENALFAALCDQARVTFIGPPPRAIRLMGDKAKARATMKALGLEPIPGSEGKIRGVGGALEVASEIGFPILLKASAGGGGKGMRIVENEADLEDAYREASIEAEKAFGDPSLYVERFIERGRHIEFQVLTDTYGHAVHLGERECSIQRNHQKLVEESPSPAIDSAIRERMGAMVTEAVARIGYVNAGTVEFLMDDEGRLYFMEMNTRLQVEHPVTEMVTGIDIVAEQIRIAANEPLAIRQEEVRLDGNAIEARINAEDPYADFRPNPGTIGRFEPPGIDSIRIDTHVRPGYKIPPFYDSLIAKVIAHGPDRKAAIGKLEEALRNFKIEGIKTTIPMHLEILASGEFRRGDYNNRSIPGWD